MQLRVLIFLVSALCLWRPQISKGQNVTGDNKGRAVKGNRKPVEPTHVVIDTPISGTIETHQNPSPAQSKPEQPVPWWKQAAKPEWVIVDVTAVYTFFAWLQWRVIRRQANLLAKQIAEAKDSSDASAKTAADTLAAIQAQAIAAQDTLRALQAQNAAITRQVRLMEISHSATVGISNIILRDATPYLNNPDIQRAFERSRVEITVHNTGSSKALSCRLSVNVIITGLAGLVTNPEDVEMMPTTDLHPGVPTTRQTKSMAGLFPDAGVLVEYAIKGSHLTVCGTLTYLDAFGKRHTTDYSATVIPPAHLDTTIPFICGFELVATERQHAAEADENTLTDEMPGEDGNQIRTLPNPHSALFADNRVRG